jgi:hypothetical protein
VGIRGYMWVHVGRGLKADRAHEPMRRITLIGIAKPISIEMEWRLLALSRAENRLFCQ